MKHEWHLALGTAVFLVLTGRYLLGSGAASSRGRSCSRSAASPTPSCSVTSSGSSSAANASPALEDRDARPEEGAGEIAFLPGQQHLAGGDGAGRRVVGHRPGLRQMVLGHRRHPAPRRHHRLRRGGRSPARPSAPAPRATVSLRAAVEAARHLRPGLGTRASAVRRTAGLRGTPAKSTRLSLGTSLPRSGAAMPATTRTPGPAGAATAVHWPRPEPPAPDPHFSALPWARPSLPLRHRAGRAA